MAPIELGSTNVGAHWLTVRAYAQDDPSSPVVVMLPAMGVPARYYKPLIGHLHARGLTVVSYDLRGQGESAPRPARGVRFGYGDLVDDLDPVLDLVEAAYPSAPRFLLGHSLGGQLALLYAATRPTRLNGVALVASGSVWYRSFTGVRTITNLIGTHVVLAVATVCGYWPGHRLGFGGRQPLGVIRDWARQARSGRYDLTSGSPADHEAELRQLGLPVLAISVDDDKLAPPSAVDHLSGKARRAVRTRRHYTRAVAGKDKLGHFSWIRAGEPLTHWIWEWVAAHRDARSAGDDRVAG